MNFRSTVWAIASFSIAIRAQVIPPTPATTNFTGFFNITTFPNQQYANASAIMAEARELAGADIFPHFMHRCVREQAYPELGANTQIDGFVEPASPFKNVFFVGQASWSSWAIDTGNREILLIDTLSTPDEAERIIVPGLERNGYKGSDVKHIIVMHEHFDHYGGLLYFQKNFEPYVYTSEMAWKTIANDTTNTPLYYNYSKAVNVEDGETLTFNNFSVKVYHTPGHTPGTVSLLFPVEDHDNANTPHIAGFYGGGGIPSGASAKFNQVNSFNRFSELAKEVGADVLMSNHQTQDGTLWNIDMMRYRQCQEEGCNMPNPWVVGVDAYRRYLVVMSLCVKLEAARNGQDLPSAMGKLDKRYENDFDYECLH